METIKLSNDVKVGDQVMVFIHNGNPEQVFEVITGTLTHIDDEEPYGSIDGKPIDFASEGHSSFMRKIVE